MASIQVKRGTRAQLEAAKPASGLAEGEPYLITDEGRLAVGTAANMYSDAALKSEVDAKLPLISGQSEINAALADDDVFALYDTSETAHRKSLMSRIWTYISGKITGAISGVLTSNLTASLALVSDGSGKLAASSVTSTELGYVSGVTSAVQEQINAKAPLVGPGFYTDGSNSSVSNTAYGGIPYFRAQRTNGSLAAPTPINTGEYCGFFAGYGRNSAGATTFVGAVGIQASGNWSSGSGNGDISFSVGIGGGSSVRAILNSSGNLLIGANPTDDASGSKLQVAGTINLASGNVYKINNVQIVGARQAAIASANVDYATGNLDTESEIITALNTTNGKINSILTALRTHGLIAP